MPLVYRDSMKLILLSGGLDSLACLAWAKQRESSISAIFFDYGQPAAVRERAASRDIASRLQVPLTEVRLPLTGGIVDPAADVAQATACVVPGRNVVMLTCAAAACHAAGGGSVVIGCCKADAAAFPDCRPETLARLEETFALAGLRVAIEAPMLRSEKADVVRFLRQQGLYELMAISSSCYAGTDCGRCYACITKQKGIEEVK